MNYATYYGSFVSGWLAGRYVGSSRGSIDCFQPIEEEI